MKRKILKIILYLCGIFCIVYPLYSKFLSYKNQSESIYNYEVELKKMEEEELLDKIRKANEFNEQNSIEAMEVDPNSIDENKDIINSYNFLELGEMIGYINLPKISIELPIYEGITVNNLSKGVAHMENTSLPSGELSTHSVLTGHTGISQAKIFDNLNEYEIGDEFYVTFLDRTTKYSVIDKKIVLPDDTSSLKVENERCLVTLVTCVPRTVNTHRLLITGEKIEDNVDYNPENIIEENESDEEEITTISNEQKTDFKLFIEFAKNNVKTFVFVIIIFVILIILQIISILVGKRGKKK